MTISRPSELTAGLQGGDPAVQHDGIALEQQYDPENCDLILWFTVTPNHGSNAKEVPK